MGVRPERFRRLLVHRRRRLGDGTFVRRIWPVGARGYGADVRGRAGSSWQGPLLGVVREARRDGLLYGAHGDPRIHEVGRRAAREVRLVEAPAPRLRW